MVTTLQQVALVCGLTVMLTLVSIAVASLVLNWFSAGPMSDAARDPKLRNQVWSAVKDGVKKSHHKGSVGKKGVPSFLLSPVAKSSSHSPLLLSSFPRSALLPITIVITMILYF